MRCFFVLESGVAWRAGVPGEAVACDLSAAPPPAARTLLELAPNAFGAAGLLLELAALGAAWPGRACEPGPSSGRGKRRRR